MSSALVRQALAFIEGEESGRKKRQSKSSQLQGPKVQNYNHPYKRKSKKTVKVIHKSEEETAEENIRKLLALSESTANSSFAEKIVERAVKRKPLAEKIEIKTEEGKSILFPEESFKSFEKEYFCS
ncbi:unnamed protein product [Parnassius apollo]|uniref:(apollo) hypothetical protein n=1 Tax=Parnassius apollo TaxID=110799 RepID=A0A8S3X7B2_PARAO|nr:unnamed protein product [Parnassius apollo]